MCMCGFPWPTVCMTFNGVVSEKTLQIFGLPLPAEYVHVTVFSGQTCSRGEMWLNRHTDPTTLTLAAYARHRLNINITLSLVIVDNQDIIPTTLHVVHALMPVVISTVWKDSIEQCPRWRLYWHSSSTTAAPVVTSAHTHIQLIMWCCVYRPILQWVWQTNILQLIICAIG